MLELLRWTWVLLTQSFLGAIIPAAIWAWDWLIVGFMWLLIGGLASAPLIVWGARKLHKRLQNGFARAGIWSLAALALWLYAHLWTASAMLWSVRVGMTESPDPGCWAVLAVLWLCESVFAIVVWSEEY
jgi:hypothetical protein